jgi:hypothetical protein
MQLTGRVWGEALSGPRARNGGYRMLNIVCLLGVGQGYINAQADHAYARGYALAAAEAGVVFQFLFQRCGGQHYQQVSRGVEDYRDRAEHYELREDVAGWGRDKLRDEGQEEERGFGIKRFGEDALAEGVSRGG